MVLVKKIDFLLMEDMVLRRTQAQPSGFPQVCVHPDIPSHRQQFSHILAFIVPDLT